MDKKLVTILNNDISFLYDQIITVELTGPRKALFPVLACRVRLGNTLICHIDIRQDIFLVKKKKKIITPLHKITIYH